jgi:hypothetical protein
VAGWTRSSDYPTTESAFQRFRPSNNTQAFLSKIALPITANYDEYSVESNTVLNVSGAGVLGNDVTTAPFALSASLVTAPGDGSVSLNSSGSFTYTPNPHFTGQETFRYRAVAVNGTQSNIAEVNIIVTSQCAGSLDSTDESFSADGGMGTINVTVPGECRWAAVSNAPGFITLTTGENGDGNGSVTYTVAPSLSDSNRFGTITVAGQTFTVYQGVRFNDVPTGHPFYSEIGKLSARGITLGCSTTRYCPEDIVTRQQMAAFIIRALGNFTPPQPVQQRFADVSPANPFYAFIDQMAQRQITLGCGGGNYCPTDPVLRGQMAAFIIRALHAPGYIPPQPAHQRYSDVPPGYAFYGHIEEMAMRQITLGCGGGNYCPGLAVTRGQMAAFLVRAFNL